MKQKYFFKLFLISCLCTTFSNSWGQTVLNKGNIALVSLDTGGEKFSFVTFVDITATTEIYFTDEEADDDLTMGTGEGILKYTAPSGGITKGTVITYPGAVSGDWSTANTGFALGNSGDGVIAYQGSSATSVTTFLHAIGEDVGDVGTFPSGTLTIGEYVLLGADDGNYIGNTIGNATTLLSSINTVNATNWATGGSVTSNPPASFTVSAAGPTVAFNNTVSSQTETNTTFATAGIPITFSNYNGSPVIITPTVDAASTAEVGDYTINLTPITFNADETKSIPLSINDDVDSDNETIIIKFTITTGTATLGTNQHTVSINDNDLPNIIINEILADPTGIDANGDGVISTTNDEFIELVNTDIVSYDLTGYTISDKTGVKHTFGAVTIPAGGSVVVFGGGTPTGISGIAMAASPSGLSLNNTDDIVTLKNPGNATVATYSYGSTTNDDQSIARFPDLTGSFVRHSTIISNPVNASPGKYNMNNLPFSTNTWKGNTDSNWNTSSNWSTGSTPIASSNVLIIKTTNQPTISAPVTVNSITIESGASLIANAAVTGSAIYKRTLTDKWHLVSSPVNGENFQNLITNNTFATGTAGGRIGIAPYKNDGTKWDYQISSSTGNIDKGTGLSVKLANAGTLKFTGSINNITTNKAITKNTNGFNLVGNPFASYVNSGTLLTDNSGILESQTIWLWNGTTYETKVTADNFVLAPGQGFFVESKTGGGDISFNTAYQSHQITDTFLRELESKSEIHISAKNNDKESIAKIYYINGATKGFDNGFDGKMFEGVSYNFSFASQLVSTNKGKNYAIQSLPKNLIEETVIPLSLKAEAGNTIVFSSKSINLPNDNLNIYLEDRLNNKIINITTKDYTYTLKNNKNGIGQFYLRVSSKNINSTPLIATTISDVSLYKSAIETITIAGLQTKTARLKIYSLTGKQVFNKIFSSNGYSNITIPKLATGIYIIELTSVLGKINKKIILE